MVDKTAPHNPFAEWMKRHEMPIRLAAEALGASPNAVMRWKKKTPPKYILLACAAWSSGTPPIQ